MQRMNRLCGARTRAGGSCRKLALGGRRRCRLHGGVLNIGRHLTEDAHHGRSLAKANAAKWLRPHQNNGLPGGLVRAATAMRMPNGRFAPNALSQPRRDRLVGKALGMVIAMQRARTVAKEATLRVVPEDPGVDDTALEPRAAPLERRPEPVEGQQTAASGPPSAATGSAESSDKAATFA